VVSMCHTFHDQKDITIFVNNTIIQIFESYYLHVY
jgi:hypothetical protein